MSKKSSEENISITDMRHHLIGLDTSIPLANGHEVTAINLDNAATTPPLKNVLYAINKFAPWYSSIHRGTGYKSIFSSRYYEHARKNIGEFVGAHPDLDTVIFVKNTTEALNKVSYRLHQHSSDVVILSSMMEHHSNDLPWRQHYHIDYIAIDDVGRLSLEDLELKLQTYSNKVKLVTVTGASNVTGHINDIDAIARLAHDYGAKILVDGAQMVPHMPVSMKEHHTAEHIDFLVFSAHKMYAPFGTGVLIGPRNFFSSGAPDIKGGGTVKVVTPEVVLWDDPPNRDEGGTPNLMGVVALDAAIQTLKEIGMSEIDTYERDLLEYALEGMLKLPNIKLYGDYKNTTNKLSIISFNIEGISHEIVAHYLSLEHGIAVRNGCFCAQPYVQKLLKVTTDDIMEHIKNPKAPHPGMVRMSLAMYNTRAEVDKFLNALNSLYEDRDDILTKYATLLKRYKNRKPFSPFE